jgi:limonene 1,2-monooxygenase
MAAGFDALALHWGVLEEEAKAYGKTVDRSQWRLVGPMHCVETKEQALRDVEYGIEHWFRYLQTVAAFPQMALQGDNLREMISFINESGIGVIGTPDECAASTD